MQCLRRKSIKGSKKHKRMTQSSLELNKFFLTILELKFFKT